MADKCALVVDDSRLARSLLSNMLKRYEIQVDWRKPQKRPWTSYATNDPMSFSWTT